MASTYLSRTPSSATNRKTFTISMWVKRSKLGVTNGITLQGVNSGNDDFAIYFTSADKLQTFSWTGGAKDFQVDTQRVFRDTNAWYHIVFVADTTQATDSNRIKIYVNGVQETALENVTYPSPNANLVYNSTTALWVGRSYVGYYFDGAISHYHSIDGTAYDPTAFGEFDANGVWKIKTSPSVTYGTNGFFILKDGNSVTDQSPNTNNFTVAGGTLTKTEDSPSNVFATLNPLSGSLSNNTLTQGNNTVQSTSGWRWRPSTICPSSGKYYAEFKPTSGSTIYTAIGVTPQVSWASIDGETIGSGTNSENKSVGYTKDGNVRQGNSTIYSGSSYTGNGDIVGVAMDLDNHKVYFSKNGVWQNSGDPTSGATGTGGFSLDATLSDWSLSTSQSGTTVSCNYGNGYFGTTAVASAGTNASGNRNI